MEKRCQNSSKGNKFSPLEIAGIAGAAGAYCAYGYDPVKQTGKMIGDAIHGYKTVQNILTAPGSQKSPHVNKYISLANPNIAQEYEESSDVSYSQRIVEGSRTALESMQRSALNYTPGINSKPVENIRGAKAWIIGGTKRLMGAKKEDVEAIKSNEYTKNYNELAQYRDSAILKRDELQRQANEYSAKLAVNESNTGKVNPNELKTLEKLCDEHNKVSKLLEDIVKAPKTNPADIKAGLESEKYASLVKKAQDYGIRPYDSGIWGESFALSGLIAAAYLGFKAAKLAETATNTAVDFGRKTIGTGAALAKAGYRLYKSMSNKGKANKEKFAKIANFSGEPFENSLNNTEKVNYSKFSKGELAGKIIQQPTITQEIVGVNIGGENMNNGNSQN